jgi:uncharacterized protein (TIGR02391 family)
MRAWTLTAQECIDLPVDALALEILRDVDANAEWHQHNWMLRVVQHAGYDFSAQAALEEAWAYLRVNILVAHKPGQSAEGAIFVTRRGRQVLSKGLEGVRAAARLEVELHDAMPERVRSLFLLGDYELAVFAAFRSIEERVRERAQADDGDIGVPLMNKAFRAGGPLSASWLEGGEIVARMSLFAGAMGVFKNPVSHRTVNYRDPTAASEAVLLADLLHRVLDDYEDD